LARCQADPRQNALGILLAAGIDAGAEEDGFGHGTTVLLLCAQVKQG